MIKCSICDQTFDENDPLIEARQLQHKLFHTPTKRKRNTTMGYVKWIKV